MKPTNTALDHLVLTVTDISATKQFYCEYLGMVAEEFEAADGSLRASLKFGDQKISLHKEGREFEPKAHQPLPGSADLCFVTELPLMDWAKYLVSAGVVIEAVPVRRTGATGPLNSIYLRDPDGNLIEISNRL